MPAPSDVLIIGGGVVGSACARALARRGVTVRVIEGGPLRGAATLAAGGMLAPVAEAVPEDPFLGFSVRARDVYRDLGPALLDETGIDIGLWLQGILQVAFTEEEVAAAKSEVAWQRQSGFGGEWLSPVEAFELAPGLSREALGAALAPEDGALDPLALLDALVQSAEASGTTLERGQGVEEILIRNDRVEGVRTASGLYATDTVIIAAGAWSGRLKGLPRPVSVEPIRGQMAAVAWPTDEPRSIIYGAGGYVLARAGEAIAGSTMEYVGFDASVTDEGLEQIHRSMTQIYPTLDGVQFQRTWAGLRPVTPDGRPLIGPDPTVEGLWYATGHGRNGILLAGYTGDVIAQLVTGEVIEHDLGTVDPGRFWKF